MTEISGKSKEMDFIKTLVNEGKIDAAVEKIGVYLNQSPEDEYLTHLENVIETLLTLHGGRTVIRFLIEHLVIDVPSLLHNLSKRDSLLRYSFLLLLKTICENESDLFLPFSEELLQSEDPNVKEAFLQLLIFMAGGEKKIDEKELVHEVISKLGDEKDFVIEKATQALKAMVKQSPDNIVKILTSYLEEHPDSSELNEEINELLKSIVSIDKIKEIVEEEKAFDEEGEEKKDESEEQIKSEKLKTDSKEGVQPESRKSEPSHEPGRPKEIQIEHAQAKEEEKELVKAEVELSDKEKELKKKDIELKKKKLELQEKEKELEEKEIIEKEKALKEKEELLKKEQQLAKVELELKKKHLAEKEKKILEEETKRIQDQLDKVEDESSED